MLKYILIFISLFSATVLFSSPALDLNYQIEATENTTEIAPIIGYDYLFAGIIVKPIPINRINYVVATDSNATANYYLSTFDYYHLYSWY